MLIRSTWTLTVAESTVLPRSYNIELVKDLHQRMNLEMSSVATPPVAFSGIIGHCTASGDFLTFHPGKFYQLSLYGLQEKTSKLIAALDLTSAIAFLGAKFDVVERNDEVTSYEGLYTTLVANEPEPNRRFDLQFLTPTAFAQNRLHLPLPVPALMFRSWLERWNSFAPVYLGGDELIGYLNHAIAVRKHSIQTRSFPVYQGRISGFVGNVLLQTLHGTEPLLANVANLLVCYAQFTGTGVKTRLGMGQTKLRSEHQ